MKTLRYLSLIVAIVCFTVSMGCNKAASCEDGIQNQGELGIDCSGPCANMGKVCNCFNGIKDGEETDVDCGGKYCSCCEPPCQPDEASNTCLEMPADTAIYRINADALVGKNPNAFIHDNGNLIININNPNNSGLIQITQTKDALAVGDYYVQGSRITIINFRDVDGKSYSSQVHGSAGKVVITEFKNEIDCKYVSGTFDVTLFDQNQDKNILLNGNFQEVLINK